MEVHFSRCLFQELSSRIPQISSRARYALESSHRQLRPLNIPQRCLFSTSLPRWPRERPDANRTKNLDDNSYSQPAQLLSQDVSPEEKDYYDKIEAESKDSQRRSPWTREGSELPPVARQRTASAMTKGKLLTTPSRMLKLIMPLTPRDRNKDRKDIEPLALLVHPQQPLSYLERLIQSELPVLEPSKMAPSITFRALDNGDNEGGEASSKDSQSMDEEVEEEQKRAKVTPQDSEGNKENRANFVRWSTSTEVGDFIRDAARGKEFAIDIEGTPEPMYVGVPSFADRTYYLRTRLRKTARRISSSADVKQECDKLAHQSAKRVAQLGFGGLLGWWAVVYWLTFRTDLTWDVMEPVTYLVGLSGLILSYAWFLWHNREVSYRSAMNFTVSRQQSKLYAQKGFDLARWEGLVEEGNRLRREIKMIADEYDVEWDESYDEGDEKVKETLRAARKKRGDKKRKKDDAEDEEEE